MTERITPQTGQRFQVEIKGLSKKGDRAIGYIQSPEECYGFVLFLDVREAIHEGKTLTCQITGISAKGTSGFAEVVAN